MALIQFGPAVSNASGSIGGTVFSHNRGGSYMRTRVVPIKVVNPFTSGVRDALSTTSRLWAGLTSEQREAWREYSASTPTINRLGQSKTLGGHVVFNRLNARLIQQGVATIDVPPVNAPPDPITSLSVAVAAGAGTAVVTFAPTPIGAANHVWLWSALVPSPGVSYVSNKWRLILKSAANAATGVDIMTELEARYGTLQAGQVLFFRGQVLSATTGLLSGFITYGTVVAP